MPYCWKCGAKLDEDARFCPNCGTAVGPPVTAPERRREEIRPTSILAIILITLIAVASVIVALGFLPVRTVDAGPLRHTVRYQTGVRTLSLVFFADVAHVNVAFEKNLMGFEGRLALSLKVSATARVGIFVSPDIFSRQWFSSNDTTVGNVLTVTSEVDVVDRGLPWYSSLNVTCDIRIDPSMNTSLDIRTGTGGIVLDTQAGVVLDSLSLEATTGGVEANLVEGVVVAGDVSVNTTTGGVKLSWGNVFTANDVEVHAITTTGGVYVSVRQYERLLGNISLRAEAVTGGVEFAVEIKGDVGAKIESSVTTGGINVDRRVGFSGAGALLQSSNYPAGHNFDVTLKTTTGGINIHAGYTP